MLRYRGHVDAAVRRLLSGPEVPSRLAELTLLGLHHEQQHQELLLTDIKHAFGSSPLWPAYRERPAESAGAAPPLRWLDYPGGLARVGHEHVCLPQFIEASLADRLAIRRLDHVGLVRHRLAHFINQFNLDPGWLLRILAARFDRLRRLLLSLEQFEHSLRRSHPGLGESGTPGRESLWPQPH